MKSGPFISLLAKAYRVEEKTVAVYARQLKEAGKLTTGARGINAPHMLPQDAARMTIALLSTDSPARSVERLNRFSAMKLNQSKSANNPPSDLFGGDCVTLEKFLVRIFCSDADSGVFSLSPYVEVNENAKQVTVKIGAEKVIFDEEFRDDETLQKDRAELFGIRRNRGLASAELMFVWAEMWADRFRGVDVQGLPLDLNHSWNKELKGDARKERMDEIEAYLKVRDPDWCMGSD